MAIQVEFLVSRDQADLFLEQVGEAKGTFPFMEMPCRFGVTGS